MGNIVSTSSRPTYSQVLQLGPPPPGAGFGTLAALPREIRDFVYEMILANGDFVNNRIDVEYYRMTAATRKNNLPAIFKASHPICREAALVAIRSNVFIICTYRANQFLVQFLDSIPDHRGFTNIRELQFTSFQHFRGGAESADLELAKRCPSLRRLKLTFHVEKLRKSVGGSHYQFTSKDVSEVVQHYNLAELFKCRMLQQITLDGISAAWATTGLIGGIPLGQVLQDVAQWLRNGFAERNMHVVVDITWR